VFYNGGMAGIYGFCVRFLRVLSRDVESLFFCVTTRMKQIGPGVGVSFRWETPINSHPWC